MATYLTLNLLFIVAVIIVFRVRFRRPSITWIVMLCTLIILTAVFDSIIIAAGIVGYDADKILGAYIIKAPVEDFFYAILAAIIIPTLWNRKGKPHVHSS